LIEKTQQHVDFVLLPIGLKLVVPGLEIKLLAHVDLLLLEFAAEGLQSLLDGLALHPLADEFRFGSHLDLHEEIVLGDAEALLDVEEDRVALVVLLQDIQNSLLLLLSSLGEDAVEQSQGFVRQERVALDVDELEQQLGDLGLEHHLLPLSELGLDVEVSLPEDDLLALGVSPLDLILILRLEPRQDDLKDADQDELLVRALQAIKAVRQVSHELDLCRLVFD